VDGQFLFQEADQEVLRRQMWQAAEFSGVQVLTYSLLSNHFHLLVRVPARTEIPDAELIRRYRILHPKETDATRKHGLGAPDLWADIETTLSQGWPEAERVRRSLQRRMGDVSEFIKTFKQRFSVWFNHTHDRYGTLWSERFRSVLVEDDRYALATVAAYIDLNPVRAGLVEDPKDYRFCGYGEAIGGGGKRIRDGLQSVIGGTDWDRALCEYRMILYGKGGVNKGDGTEAGRIPPEEARKVLNSGGLLPIAAVLRCRVRYFTDGAVLGSKEFVAEALRGYQAATGLRSRQTTPRAMLGADWADLTTMRGLRRNVFG
jgi:putative transposase